MEFRVVRLEESQKRINEVTMQVSLIATAAEEQTARSAEETAAAAAQLTGQATRLQQLVARFRL